MIAPLFACERRERIQGSSQDCAVHAGPTALLRGLSGGLWGALLSANRSYPTTGCLSSSSVPSWSVRAWTAQSRPGRACRTPVLTYPAVAQSSATPSISSTTQLELPQLEQSKAVLHTSACARPFLPGHVGSAIPHTLAVRYGRIARTQIRARFVGAYGRSGIAGRPRYRGASLRGCCSRAQDQGKGGDENALHVQTPNPKQGRTGPKTARTCTKKRHPSTGEESGVQFN